MRGKNIRKSKRIKSFRFKINKPIYLQLLERENRGTEIEKKGFPTNPKFVQASYNSLWKERTFGVTSGDNGFVDSGHFGLVGDRNRALNIVNNNLLSWVHVDSAGSSYSECMWEGWWWSHSGVVTSPVDSCYFHCSPN